MKNKFVRISSIIALIAIVLLQFMWLYNTYFFYKRELINDIDNIVSKSFQEEVYTRLNDPSRKKIEGAQVEGASPELDDLTNAIYFNEFLINQGYTIDNKKLDSIIGENLKNEVGEFSYSISLLDRANHKTNKSLFYSKEIPIRIDKSAFLYVDIQSYNEYFFKKMILLLIASVLLIVIVIYCLFWQIKIIQRQERISEIRNDFTRAMVHDMKNPITTMLMGLKALRSGKLDSKVEIKEQYYDIVTKESEHLLKLTNNILKIAQFEEDKVTINKTDIDIKVMFESILSKYKLTSKCEFNWSAQYNDIHYIYGDPEYMYEVLMNLIDNAIKYSKDKIVINIDCTKDNHNSIIKVKDNGIGISLEDQKRIFQKFERVLSTKNKNVTGFGLGLNYAYQVVEAHNGTIELNSIPNVYTEVIINIPNRDDKITIN